MIETAWLFTRGPQSVRIVRVAAPDGRVHLLVHGPGDADASHEFEDVVACMRYQSELERRLVAQGFMLEQFTADRRVAPDRSSVRDRRRP